MNLFNSERFGRFQADLAREQNILGQKIAHARKRAGLTQGELSRRLEGFGVHVKTPGVNKWEKGETVPNAYQLVALCHALCIREGLDYFTGPVSPEREGLNQRGLRLLESYRAFLESDPRCRVQSRVVMVEMPVSLLPASAGTGDFLDAETMELRSFPADCVPEGAQFAVPVDGDSMEPLYHDRQLVWIQPATRLNVGETGLFVLDGQGYLKIYDERKPENVEEYLDSSGVLHPQIVLLSQNPAYAPRYVTPDLDFRIVGRVLN